MGYKMASNAMKYKSIRTKARAKTVFI